LGPWPGNRGGAAFAGPIPARARLAGGEGGVERLEEVALYLEVALDGVGGGLRRAAHGRRWQVAALGHGGGAPEALGGGKGVGELPPRHPMAAVALLPWSSPLRSSTAPNDPPASSSSRR